MPIWRKIVGAKRRRFQILFNSREDTPLAAEGLFVLENLAVLSFPSAEFSEGIDKNSSREEGPLTETRRFLDESVSSTQNYRVFNCCSEWRYESYLFREQVSEYNIDFHSPNFPLISSFVEELNDFLNNDSGNLALVHCTDGRRSAMMICCYLLASKKAPDAASALKIFTRERTGESVAKNNMGTPLENLTLTASQIRYVHYFETYLQLLASESNVDIVSSIFDRPKAYRLEQIRISNGPFLTLLTRTDRANAEKLAGSAPSVVVSDENERLGQSNGDKKDVLSLSFSDFGELGKKGRNEKEDLKKSGSDTSLNPPSPKSGMFGRSRSPTVTKLSYTRERSGSVSSRDLTITKPPAIVTRDFRDRFIWFCISRSSKTLFFSQAVDELINKIDRDHLNRIPQLKKDTQNPMIFMCNHAMVSGDVLIEFFDDSYSNVLFRCNLNTFFLENNTASMNTDDKKSKSRLVKTPSSSSNPAKLPAKGSFKGDNLIVLPKDPTIKNNKISLFFGANDLDPPLAPLPADLVLEMIFSQIEKATPLPIEIVLHNRILLEHFREFLQANHAGDNLQCWEDIQSFKKMKWFRLQEDNPSEKTRREILDESWRIYSTYFDKNASIPINLAATLITKIRRKLKEQVGVVSEENPFATVRPIKDGEKVVTLEAEKKLYSLGTLKNVFDEAEKGIVETMRPDVFARWLLSPAYGRAFQNYKAAEQEFENKERMTRTTPSASVGNIFEDRSRGSSDASDGDLSSLSSSSVVSSNSSNSGRKSNVTKTTWLNSSWDGMKGEESKKETKPEASAASGGNTSSLSPSSASAPKSSNRVKTSRNNSLLTSIRKEMYKNRNSREDRNSIEDDSIIIANSRREAEEDAKKRSDIQFFDFPAEENNEETSSNNANDNQQKEIMKVVEKMEEEEKEKEKGVSPVKVQENSKEKAEEITKAKPLPSPPTGKKDVIAALRRARSTINFGNSPLDKMEERDHCETCMKPIHPESGDGGVFLGFSWYHTDCLACSGCKRTLAGLSPVIMDRKPYCHICIVKNNPAPELSPSVSRNSINLKDAKGKEMARVDRRKSYIAPFFQDCESCGKGINSIRELSQLNGKSWHTTCFTCSKCSSTAQPMSSDLTYDENKRELICKSCLLPDNKPRSPSKNLNTTSVDSLSNGVAAVNLSAGSNIKPNDDVQEQKECQVCQRNIPAKEAKEIHSKVFCIICYQKIMVIHQTRKHKK